MNKKNFIEQLSELLVGKKVIAVYPPMDSELVAGIHTDDGNCFQIGATDLGFWIQDGVIPNQPHTKFSTFMGNLLSIVRYSDLEHPVKFSIDGEYVKAEVLDLERLKSAREDPSQFLGLISSFSEKEQEIINHPNGMKILAEVLQMGNPWTYWVNLEKYPKTGLDWLEDE